MLISFDKDHLIIESGPVSYPPIVNADSVIVQEDGELTKGVYYYAITAVGVNGESAPYNLLRVSARNKKNSIILSWKPIPYITEYRIYRGICAFTFDGYMTVFTKTGYFQDNGLGVLSLDKPHPPEYTPVNMMWDRKIHKSSIHKVNHLFLGGEPFTMQIFLTLYSGEEIVIDMTKVLNRPDWQASKKFGGMLRALAELEDWRNGN